MGLMSVEVAGTKVCRGRMLERLFFKVITSAHHPSLMEKELHEHDYFCDPKNCAHWNYTFASAGYPAEDLELNADGKETGRIKIEAMERVGARTSEEYAHNFLQGYCGLSAPLDEIHDIINAKAQGGQ